MTNKCLLMGTIIKRENRKTISGKAVMLFTLRSVTDGEEAFLNCVAYSALAEIIDRDFDNRKKIFIECKATSHKKPDGDVANGFVVEKFYYMDQR